MKLLNKIKKIFRKEPKEVFTWTPTPFLCMTREEQRVYLTEKYQSLPEGPEKDLYKWLVDNDITILGL